MAETNPQIAVERAVQIILLSVVVAGVGAWLVHLLWAPLSILFWVWLPVACYLISTKVKVKVQRCNECLKSLEYGATRCHRCAREVEE